MKRNPTNLDCDTSSFFFKKMDLFQSQNTVRTQWEERSGKQAWKIKEIMDLSLLKQSPVSFPTTSCENYANITVQVICPKTAADGMRFCTDHNIPTSHRWHYDQTCVIYNQQILKLSSLTRDCCCFPVSEKLSLVAGIICVSVNIIAIHLTFAFLDIQWQQGWYRMVSTTGTNTLTGP